MKKFLLFATSVLSAAVLSGCGGGGSNPAAGVVVVDVANNNGGSVFFAYQDGSGTWQTIPPTINGYKYSYQFNVNDPSGKYGVAVYCTSNLKGNLFHALVSERNSLYVDCGTPTHALSGQVLWNNSPLTYEAFAYWGTQYWTATTSGSYSLTVREGRADVIGLFDNDTSGNAQYDNIVHVVIYRNLNVNGTTQQDIDFTNSPQADTTTYSWNCGATNSHRVSFLSAGGTTIYNIGGASYQPIIPNTLLQSGDFWNYASTGTSGSATTTFQEFHVQPGNYTCQGFPNHMSQGATFQDVDVGQNTQRIQISWNAYSNGLGGHQTQVYKLDEYMSGGSYYWYMHWTEGWLGNSPSYTYTFPNLSSVTGWNNTWYPSEATQSGRGDWVAYTSNVTTVGLLNLYFDGTASNGMEYVTAQYPN